MAGKASAKPSRGVAEAFADVAAPRGRAAAEVGAGEPALPPFRAPAELAGRARDKFPGQHALPAPASLVRETDPHEMEDLVDQDPLELPGAGQEFGVEQNPPVWNVGGSQMRAERTAKLDADGAAG